MLDLPKITLKFTISRPANYTPCIINNSDDIARVIRPMFDSNTFDLTEEMLLICLNRRNEVMHYCTISRGGLTGTVCDPKVIFMIALRKAATSIVLAHNHPSGSIQPSRADDDMTQRIKQASFLLEIRLIDHLILTHDNYYSYADEGRF